MRLHASLVLAFLALSARAASLPSHAVKTADLEKKLTEVVKEVLKEDAPVENNVSEQELLDQANSVSDTDNNLRNVLDKIEDIPVKIITEEEKPAVKNFGIERGTDVVPEETVSNVKREEIDLKNPGKPQRQEHDTQSPEDMNAEQETVLTIKQGIKQGSEGIDAGLKVFVSNNAPLLSLQNSILEAQKSFTKQLSDFNQEVVGFVASALSNPEKKPIQPDDVAAKSSLESAAKEETAVTGADGASSTTEPTGPFAAWQENINNYIQQIQASVAQMQDTMSQYINQAQGAGGDATAAAPGSTATGQDNSGVAGAQSDAAATTEKPSGFFQTLQSNIQNIFVRPGAGQAEATPAQQNVQADQPAAATQAPSGPFAQVFQNVANFIQRPQANNKPQTQSAAQQPAASSTSQEGANSVPAGDKPVETKPQEQKEKPTTAAPIGPIQQIVQRNPIVQGIAGTVQRIQSAITNPEKPRERAHLHRGHGGHGDSAAVGDSNSNGLAAESEPLKEEKQTVEEPVKEVTPQPIKEEAQQVHKHMVESTEIKTE